MLVVESGSLDIYQNLALEEYLMETVPDAGPVLFLWRSSCAVVMGKNQNPWRECRLDLMEQDGVPLARRISGGGTVYHDGGNLNYCVITDRGTYDGQQVYAMVFQALQNFDVEAEVTGRSNLSVGGLKFSGNAFAFRKGRALHHGTLLLQTDLERLNRYLGSMLDGIETHAVASVPADVTNLNLSVEAVSEALKTSFADLFGDGRAEWRSDRDFDADAVGRLRGLCDSDKRRYESTPSFTVQHGGERLKVTKGIVLDGAFAGNPFKETAFSLFC